MRRRGIGGPGRGIGGPGRMAARRMAVRMASRRRRRRRRRRIILVGGMVALGASAVHKYSKKDVERIEAQTGKPAEELSDEELQQATQQLGIEPEDMSDEEWNEFEAEDAKDDDDESEGGGDDYIEQLERLAELHKQGILTDDEFEAKKKQLLNL